ELIVSSLDILTESGIQFQNLDFEVYKVAINLMVAYDLTFYDAVYAALAQLFQAPLLTANPKDHKKIKEIKVVEL
ncbi:MAG: PIN domain-containing protein, partial [Candidatus Doudnabacteria bacterium]|nr:PIN domain-containing protein [Candidatus Doudnabacteria bacterium]